jgi:molybdenum cofactor cytidylyltransferase
MSATDIAAVVLAAGASTRMGAHNKLLMTWEGESLVRRAVRAARGAGIDDIVVVVPSGAEEITEALRDQPVRIMENPDHAQGIASTIRTGIGAVAPAYTGAVVLLADMPLVSARHVSLLLDAFATARSESSIVVPYHRGERGNPVLWGRDHFDELTQLRGDVGARTLLERRRSCVVRVESADDAVLVDVDTPQDWARLHTAAAS